MTTSTWIHRAPTHDLANDLAALARSVDTLFGAVGARGLDGRHGLRHAADARFPHLEVTEDEATFTLTGDLPGVSPDALTVEVEGRTLRVAGQREAAPDGWRVQRQERGAWRFERTWRLPEQVDADGVTATLRHGVLSLRLPKAAPSVRRVPVSA